MSDQELFNGLKNGDEQSIRMIYSTLFPAVRNWVLKNSGNEADAYDVFQETLEVVLLKIERLNSSLIGLIMRVAKNKWIDKLRKSNKESRTKEELRQLRDHEQLDGEEQYAINKQEKYKLMEKYFSELSETCQMLMSLLKKGMKVEEVVREMSFSSANTLYRRKAACMERWSTLIKEDKLYKELF